MDLCVGYSTPERQLVHDARVNNSPSSELITTSVQRPHGWNTRISTSLKIGMYTGAVCEELLHLALAAEATRGRQLFRARLNRKEGSTWKVKLLEITSNIVN